MSLWLENGKLGVKARTLSPNGILLACSIFIILSPSQTSHSLSSFETFQKIRWPHHEHRLFNMVIENGECFVTLIHLFANCCFVSALART